MLRVQAFQALARHVRINLRSRDIRMPQEHLHHSQICPMIEQMCGERMPQDVRREWRIDPRQDCVFLDEQPKGLPRHGRGTRGHKQRGAGSLPEQLRARLSHITIDPVRRLSP